mmetsp:Transcript_13063/g.52318  ORF Transcript_13063/g.52318 Transcript_13063/m.52318 type:complete len:91 (+) Transcript_13063:372-644(+)
MRPRRSSSRSSDVPRRRAREETVEGRRRRSEQRNRRVRRNRVDDPLVRRVDERNEKVLVVKTEETASAEQRQTRTTSRSPDSATDEATAP